MAIIIPTPRYPHLLQGVKGEESTIKIIYQDSLKSGLFSINISSVESLLTSKEPSDWGKGAF